MNHLSGLGYDATGTEHNFAILFGAKIGQRGKPWDADNFRGGDHGKLGRLIEETAQRLEERAKSLEFEPEDSEGGGISARLFSAIKTLRGLGKDLAASPGKEPEDYHWLIVGELVLTIASLFDYVEERR